MQSARSQSGVLRLVHPDRGADASPMRQGDDPRRTSVGPLSVRKGKGTGESNATLWVPARRVGQENRSAASLSPDDARWMLARRAAEAIEGGRAAILRPEVRARLVATGERLGLRPFDANLILAIVQDDARTGQSRVSDLGNELSADAASRIGVVRPAPVDHRTSNRRIRTRMAISFTAGIALAILVIRWLQP